jgi:DMSO/TMAO reductase YedYZ molybdopterin-dependent catalytic subunit
MGEPLPEHPRETSRERIPLGRAAFLGTIAAGVVGVGVLSKLGGAGLGSLASDVPGLDAIAPSSGWRIYNVKDPMPVFDPATYALEIGGLVEQPVRLSWDEVQQLPMRESVSDFHCVTGWSVPDVHWNGILPSTLIDLVRPKPEAAYVTFQSLEEPYYDQLTMEQFKLPHVLLATHMDRKPLVRVHGAPLRLVIPQMYGYKGVKWVSSIRFEAEEDPGYWETRGYDADAWVGRDVYH